MPTINTIYSNTISSYIEFERHQSLALSGPCPKLYLFGFCIYACAFMCTLFVFWGGGFCIEEYCGDFICFVIYVHFLIIYQSKIHICLSRMSTFENKAGTSIGIKVVPRFFFITVPHPSPGPLFTHRTVVLLQDIMKSRSHDIRV